MLRIGVAWPILLDMTRQDVVALLREACDQAPSVRHWAKEHNISLTYVIYVLNGERDPGPMILDVLGLEREEFTYRRKEAK